MARNRISPQLLKSGELQYIIETAQEQVVLQLLQHIAAMYQTQDRLVNALQDNRLAVTSPSGYSHPGLLKARVIAAVDNALAPVDPVDYKV